MGIGLGVVVKLGLEGRSRRAHRFSWSSTEVIEGVVLQLQIFCR